ARRQLDRDDAGLRHRVVAVAPGAEAVRLGPPAVGAEEAMGRGQHHPPADQRTGAAAAAVEGDLADRGPGHAVGPDHAAVVTAGEMVADAGDRVAAQAVGGVAAGGAAPGAEAGLVADIVEGAGAAVDVVAPGVERPAVADVGSVRAD